MNERLVYSLDLGKLSKQNPLGNDISLRMRRVLPADYITLAELMISAYAGTIDYSGETLNEAIIEVQAYQSGQRGGLPLQNSSRLSFVGDMLVSACLVGMWNEKRTPIVAYIMTRAEYKNLGIGKHTLVAVLHELVQDGFGEVLAVITQGNIPSERLFANLGFERL